jgi:hypothetical protein
MFRKPRLTSAQATVKKPGADQARLLYHFEAGYSDNGS